MLSTHILQIDPIWHSETTFSWNRNDGSNVCDDQNVECTNEITTHSHFRHNLKIENPTAKDAGGYKFISTTSIGSDANICPILFTLYGLNHVSKDITHVSFEQGKNKTFECNIEVSKFLFCNHIL